jgi:hypothetical protein
VSELVSNVDPKEDLYHLCLNYSFPTRPLLAPMKEVLGSSLAAG